LLAVIEGDVDWQPLRLSIVHLINDGVSFRYFFFGKFFTLHFFILNIFIEGLFFDILPDFL
jgi:hypothetical protein